jgi:hypothetical protein
LFYYSSILTTRLLLFLSDILPLNGTTAPRFAAAEQPIIVHANNYEL